MRSHLTTATPARLVWLFVIRAIVGSVSSGRGQSVGGPAAKHDAQPPVQQQPSEPTGASRCLFCHPAEVEGYARSAMAHSLRQAGQEPDGTVSANRTEITIYSSTTA